LRSGGAVCRHVGAPGDTARMPRGWLPRGSRPRGIRIAFNKPLT
jgi:hypothetical protein